MKLKSLVALALACIVGVARAQDDYDNIAVGATVHHSIGLGFLAKPLPLPEGQWKLVARNVIAVPLTSSTRNGLNSESAGTMPRHILTFKNSDPNSILPVVVLSIFGRLTNLVQSAINCPAPSNTEWVDAVTIAGLPPICARTVTTNAFRSMAAQGPRSSNSWVKAHLDGLSEDAGTLPNNVTIVDVAGIFHRGFSIKQTYFLKQEGNLNDPAYADYLKPWIHEMALTVGATLPTEASVVMLPKNFTSASPVVSGGGTGVAVANSALAGAVALKDIKITSHFDFTEVSSINFRDALFACIPNYATKPSNVPLPESMPKAFNSSYTNTVAAPIFLLKGNQGLCLNRSVFGFPIFAADSFLLTDNPVGVPSSVADLWYQKIAENVAKQGSARVMYVFKNKNAIMVRYWVDPSKPIEINYQSEFKKVGGWEPKDVDFVFENEGLNSVTAAVANESGYGKKTFPY
jgi:hypothetical protein